MATRTTITVVVDDTRHVTPYRCPGDNEAWAIFTLDSEAGTSVHIQTTEVAARHLVDQLAAAIGQAFAV